MHSSRAPADIRLQNGVGLRETWISRESEWAAPAGTVSDDQKGKQTGLSPQKQRGAFLKIALKIIKQGMGPLLFYLPP